MTKQAPRKAAYLSPIPKQEYKKRIGRNEFESKYQSNRWMIPVNAFIDLT